MSSNRSPKITEYGKAALRHAAVIVILLLLCLGVTQQSCKLFAPRLFLPLAAFITLAIPAFAKKAMAAESVIAAALLVCAHFIVAGTSGKSILFILLYLAAGALGAGFGYAARKLSRRG